MRRWIAVLLCLLMAAALCACGSKAPAEQTPAPAQTEAPATPEPTPTPEPTAEPAAAEQPQPQEEEETVTEAPRRESSLPGLSLHEAEPEEPESEETAETDPEAAERLELAMTFIEKPVDDLIAVFGEPKSREYVPSCLRSGEDGELEYDGFTVYTFREGNAETVTGVR